MVLNTGKVLNNRYRIVALLGQGGFGAVYRAWDLNLKRPCALKENLETNVQGQKQFENEATILANLTHPNLPRVTDHFILEGQGQYLVMDYVEGQDLNEVLSQRGPIPIRQAVQWISQINDALHYLHSQKIPVIHRDVKPANIRVTSSGTAYLVDFGLVKLYQTQVYTTPGARGVTPGFSPPEQYGQGGTDARTDIYALAATLYTLVTGKVPPESVHLYGQEKLTPAHIENPNVPHPITKVIEKALSLDPKNRYQNANEFKSALNAAMSVPVGLSTVVDPGRTGTVVAPGVAGTVVVPPISQPTTGTTTLQPSNPLVSALKENRALQAALGFVMVLLLGYGFYKLIQPPPPIDDPTLTPTPETVVAEDVVTEVPTNTPEPGAAPITPSDTSFVPPPMETTITPTPSKTPNPTETYTPSPFVANFDLAFASNRNGEFQVYLMDTQNNENMRLSNPSGYDRAWWPSFCGNRIAVEAVDLNGSESNDQWIYFLEIDNGGNERISAPGSSSILGVPRCSPGGGFLTYSAKISGDWKMIFTDFSDTYKISPPDALVSGYASWPISGYNFIFQVITEGDFRNLIYRMNGHPSGGQYSKIDDGGNPALSPDGNWMTYSCESNGDNRTICIASSDGSNVEKLHTIIRKKAGGAAIQPSTAWSADGQWIYFASAEDGDWDIYRIHPNGSGLKNLTNDWGSSDEIMPALKW